VFLGILFVLLAPSGSHAYDVWRVLRLRRRFLWIKNTPYLHGPKSAVGLGGGGDDLAAFPSRLQKACDMESPLQNQAQLQGMHSANEPKPQKQE